MTDSPSDGPVSIREWVSPLLPRKRGESGTTAIVREGKGFSVVRPLDCPSVSLVGGVDDRSGGIDTLQTSGQVRSLVLGID